MQKRRCKPIVKSYIMVFNFFSRIIILLYFFLPSSVCPQSLDLATGSSNLPIEITANNGIEWQRDKKIMIASGRAKATRGNVSVEADKLRAYYKKDKSGVSNLSRIDAIGKVLITSPTQKLTGEMGSYDLIKGILVMTGKKVKLFTGESKITADQQLEFYEKKEMAVARKNALANHNGKLLRANTLVALFFKDEKGKSQLRRVQAFDNVRVITKTESAWADKGIYDVTSGIATLDGNVRLNRDGNQLNGQSAIINLNTGISKLLTSSYLQSPSQSGNQKPKKRKRVRGYLRPRKN